MKVRQDKIVWIFLGVGDAGSGEPGLAGSNATAPGLPLSPIPFAVDMVASGLQVKHSV